MNKSRFKNPWFWIGIIGVILTAMGVSADTLTTWASVWQAVINLISNPYLLGSVAIAIVGVFVDPTTSGLTDDDIKTYWQNRV